MNQSPDNTLFYMLHDVTRQIRKHFDRRATRLELTRAQWRALKVTSRHEGLSQSEIAERTGTPLGTVKMRVKLAMAKLATLLKEEEA